MTSATKWTLDEYDYNADGTTYRNTTAAEDVSAPEDADHNMRESLAGIPMELVIDDPDELAGLVQEKVLVRESYDPITREPVYGFLCLEQDRFLPCTVDMQSGSAGSKTTECSFVYDVYSLGGALLLEDVSPVWNRPPLGKMTEGEHGTVYKMRSGSAWVLWQVDEQPDAGSC
jgi:hypothetical protein